MMSVLAGGGLHLQTDIHLTPELKKLRTEVIDLEDRTISKIPEAHAAKTLRAFRKTTQGLRGANDLPNLILVGLVSQYDVLFKRLLKAAFEANSSIEGIAGEKTVTLKELKTFSSVDEAVEHMVERQIDELLHDDHGDQLRALNTMFKLKVDLEERCVKDFYEICERRNLITHNQGVINKRYLEKCTAFKVDISKRKIADKLGVNAKYYRSSVNTVHELLLKLVHYTWKKIVPLERDLADQELSELCLEIIQHGEYALANELLRYAIEESTPKNDRTLRVMVVNRANALKLNGDVEGSKKLLEKYDWSATNEDFEVCVAAVKGDVNFVIKKMRADGPIDRDSYRDWPIFQPLLTDEQFRKRFQEVFGEELGLDDDDEDSAAKTGPKKTEEKSETAVVDSATAPTAPDNSEDGKVE